MTLHLLNTRLSLYCVLMFLYRRHYIDLHDEKQEGNLISLVKNKATV